MQTKHLLAQLLIIQLLIIILAAQIKHHQSKIIQPAQMKHLQLKIIRAVQMNHHRLTHKIRQQITILILLVDYRMIIQQQILLIVLHLQLT